MAGFRIRFRPPKMSKRRGDYQGSGSGGITISGKVVFNHFPAIAEGLSGIVGQIIEEHGKQAEADARRLVPVDTGRLRDSIHFEMTDTASGALSADTEYADDVEYGTAHAAAQPYIRPAFERLRQPLLDDLSDLEPEIREAMNRG